MCGLVCGFSAIDGKVDCDYVISVVVTSVVGQLNKVSVQVSELFLFTCVCVLISYICCCCVHNWILDWWIVDY